MYTPLLLFGIGMLGIVSHNLMKMDSINRKQEGNFNYLSYLAIEKFTILLSIIVVGIAVVAMQEVKVLANAGNYLAIGYFSIGFMSQSILVKVMGKAEKMLNDK